MQRLIPKEKAREYYYRKKKFLAFLSGILEFVSTKQIQ